MSAVKLVVALTGVFLLYALVVTATPSASNVAVLPLNATAGQDIYCNYTYSSPINENYTEQGSIYQWWKNAIDQNLNSQRVAAGNLSPTDKWYCAVTPSDGQNNGTKVASNGNLTVLGTVLNPTVYVANNQSWNTAGYYAGPDRVVDFNGKLTAALSTCNADPDGYCNVSLNFSSDAAGLLNVTDLEIYYQPTAVSLQIQSISSLLANNLTYVFEFVVRNNGTSTVSNVTWTLSMGDGTTLNSIKNASLAVGETMLVYAKYTYAAQGSYTVTANATAIADSVSTIGTLSVETRNFKIGGIRQILSNGPVRVIEFNITNLATSNLTVNWTANMGDGTTVNSLAPLNLTPNASILVYLQHNYAQGHYTLTSTAQANGTLDSATLDIEARQIRVTNLSVLNSSGLNRTFWFTTTNLLQSTNMSNVSWRFDTGNGTITSTIPTLLSPNEKVLIYIQNTYASAGTFNINASATNATYNDYTNRSITIP